MFVDVTSVAINCKLYVYHPYVGTVNAKLTTVSLVINLLHFQVFRSWDDNLQFQKRVLDSNPTQFLSSDLPCSEHPAILIDTAITWSHGLQAIRISYLRVVLLKFVQNFTNYATKVLRLKIFSRLSLSW